MSISWNTLLEAFVKTREQAKAYLEMKGELTSGLYLINNINLEYFPVEHKAEIFCLKGDFLLKMNDCENVNLAYSNAITLFKHLPKGWISWGKYCDMIYKETREELWLEYTVSCFFQGIKYGVSNSRSHLARILYLLSFDTPNEHVGKSFDKYLDQLPHWVWLAYIPQLLLSLQRNEAPHCKLVLLKIAAVYPQALYYWLRTYLMERRDVANKSELGRYGCLNIFASIFKVDSFFLLVIQHRPWQMILDFKMSSAGSTKSFTAVLNIHLTFLRWV